MDYSILINNLSPVLGNIIAWPLVGFVLGFYALLPLTIIEGWLIKRFFSWSWKKSLLGSFLANLISTLIGGISLAIGIAIGMNSVPSDIGLSIWGCFKFWIIIALVMWILFLVVTIIVEGYILHLTDRKNPQRSRFRRTLRLASYVNLITYAVILPIWLISQHPHMKDFEPVPISEYKPNVSQVLVYSRHDGTIWLADTQDNQIGKIADAPELEDNEFVGYKINEDKTTLTGIIGTKKRKEVKGYPDEWIVTNEREFFRYALEDLSTEQKQTISSNIKVGYPKYEFKINMFFMSNYTWRDDLLVDWINNDFIYNIWLYPNKDRASLDDLEIQKWEHLTFSGFVPPLYFLDAGMPHILPGGRYVLLECAEEVVLLDVEERKAHLLFPGMNPLPLVKPTIFRNRLRDPDEEENPPWE